MNITVNNAGTEFKIGLVGDQGFIIALKFCVNLSYEVIRTGSQDCVIANSSLPEMIEG